MGNNIIEKTVEINAPLNKVWRVFTDPDVTLQMGGYYETDWKAGSAFGWKAQNGNMQTNGVLLAFQPQRLIKHNLFEPGSEAIMAVITYEFRQKDGYTLLSGKEELTQSLPKEAFDDASMGWASALNAVKALAEKY